MEGYDISKIISVIMENPGLVEQIRTLAAPKPETQETAILSKEPEDENQNVNTNAQAESDRKADDVSASTKPDNSMITTKRHRRELLCALKPYVSKSRAKTIETIISITDVLDALNSRNC